MDMSFARRRKGAKKTDTDGAAPDLSVLLADVSARQGASRTAAIQSRLQSASTAVNTDPLIDVFAPDGTAATPTGHFSAPIAQSLNGRQR